jgi:hypothetical protein
VLLNIFDKFLFGALLIITLQVPILADHYLQYLTGYFESTKTQVEGYESTAVEHQFSDVNAMIDAHLKNPEPSVRTDAQQKLKTLEEFNDLKTALILFHEGNVFKKAAYMFNPSRWHILQKVLPNFKPSIPLSVAYFIYSFVIALLLSSGILFLVRFFVARSKTKVVQNKVTKAI